jgi:hypothetical protein
VTDNIVPAGKVPPAVLTAVVLATFGIVPLDAEPYALGIIDGSDVSHSAIRSRISNTRIERWWFHGEADEP